MKKIILIIACFLLLSASAYAEDLYYAQSQAGDNSGSSCANAIAIGSIVWGAGTGQIGADDTLHLCGTLTSALVVGASGSAGHVITIKFEENAKFSKNVWTGNGAINTYNRHYILIDGGTNGIIENTDNGSELGNQLSSIGITITLSNNIEIKNLIIRNIYVHSLVADTYNVDTNGAIYAQGPGSNVSIHDCTFSHSGRQINFLMAYAPASNISIYNNDFGNCSIGINIGLSNALTTINVYNNTFHDYDNWDTTGNVYHTNGMHIYASAAVSGLNFYTNRFYGYGGGHRTSELLYMEIDAAGGSYDNCKIYNNKAEESTDALGNFGIIAIGGGYGTFTNTIVANNTLIGNGESTGILTNRPGNNTIVFSNNILKDHKIAVMFYNSLVAGTWDYNFYTGNTNYGASSNGFFTGLAAWQTEVSGESHAVSNATSGVNADGTIAASSPAVDHGVSNAASFTTDYLGNTRSGSWDIGAYEYDGASDTAPPTITSATINAAGTGLTMVYSEVVYISVSTGFTLEMIGGAAGLSYKSGSGSNTIIYDITGRAIADGETGTLDYVNVENGIQDAAGNDLASTGASDETVTNGSEYTPSATTYTVTVQSIGDCTVSTLANQVVVSGATASYTCAAVGNSGCAVWTGTCGGTGTTSFTSSAITGDCTVIQSCFKIAPDITIGSGATVTIGSGAAATIQ